MPLPKPWVKSEHKKMYRHIPVMINEAMNYLNPQPGEVFADCTLGGGGYSFEIAKQIGANGKLISIDLDDSAITNAKLKAVESGLSNISFYHENFRDLARVVEAEFGASSGPWLDGVVFDLGLSSAQLEDSARGFSFQNNGPLSMAFGSSIPAGRTEAIVNLTSVSDLARIFRDYGEERFALRIAKSIDEARRIKHLETSDELVAAIAKAVPAAYRRSRLHFATRSFQALRIATNDELGNLKTLLDSLRPLLKINARIVGISFHSLEDRILKHFFKEESKDCLCPPEVPLCVCGHKAWLKLLTRKAVIASQEEIMENPRSRSAKLRAARVIL